MNRTSEQVREALVQMCVQILSNKTMPNLTSLWLSRLGSSEEGDQLLLALCSSNITSLKYLNLGDNKSWWASAERTAMFAQFIKKQEQLEDLHLKKNNLSAANLAEILAAVRHSDNALKSIKKLHLDECNWESESSCELIASIIAEAPKLELVRMFN